MKAIDSSMENRWSWKWRDEGLEISIGNIGPVKYKKKEIALKKIEVPGTAWYRSMWCEDKISHANNGKKKL